MSFNFGVYYLGKDVGNLYIKANIDSVISSEIYEVLDCVAYDSGVTGTTAQWIVNQGKGSKTITDSGTILSNANSTIYDVFLNNPNASQTIYGYNAPLVVEVDIIEYTGSRASLQMYSATTGQTCNVISSIGHWKIVYDGTTVMSYRDGTASTIFQRNMPDMRIAFIIPTDCSVKFKDFKIYLI